MPARATRTSGLNPLYASADLDPFAVGAGGDGGNEAGVVVSKAGSDLYVAPTFHLGIQNNGMGLIDIGHKFRARGCGACGFVRHGQSLEAPGREQMRRPKCGGCDARGVDTCVSRSIPQRASAHTRLEAADVSPLPRPPLSPARWLQPEPTAGTGCDAHVRVGKKPEPAAETVNIVPRPRTTKLTREVLLRTCHTHLVPDVQGSRPVRQQRRSLGIQQCTTT